jgi:hypothetical protein
MEDALNALETLRAATELRDSLPRASRDRRDIERLVDRLSEALHAAILAEDDPDLVAHLQAALEAAHAGVVEISGTDHEAG